MCGPVGASNYTYGRQDTDVKVEEQGEIVDYYPMKDITGRKTEGEGHQGLKGTNIL
jgi:hypothetical protein